MNSMPVNKQKIKKMKTSSVHKKFHTVWIECFLKIKQTGENVLVLEVFYINFFYKYPKNMIW